MVHSGEEYAEEPTPKMRRVGARAVAAGAFLVIGNHPHVAQARSTTALPLSTTLIFWQEK